MRRTPHRIATISVLGLALAGCGISQRAEREQQVQDLAARNAQLQEQGRIAVAACDAQYQKGNPKTAVARIKCLNDGLSIQLPTFGPDQDLVQAFMAERVVIAERIQAGKMTYAEGTAAIAEKWSQAVNVSQQRRDVTAAVAAQQSAAAAQQQAANLAAAGLIMQNNQAILAQQQAQQQQSLSNVVRPPPAIAPTNCTTSYIGNQAYTHCQ